MDSARPRFARSGEHSGEHIGERRRARILEVAAVDEVAGHLVIGCPDRARRADVHEARRQVRRGAVGQRPADCGAHVDRARKLARTHGQRADQRPLAAFDRGRVEQEQRRRRGFGLGQRFVGHRQPCVAATPHDVVPALLPAALHRARPVHVRHRERREARHEVGVQQRPQCRCQEVAGQDLRAAIGHRLAVEVAAARAQTRVGGFRADQSGKHHGTEAAAGHAADRERLPGELRIEVVPEPEQARGPVSGANAAAGRSDRYTG